MVEEDGGAVMADGNISRQNKELKRLVMSLNRIKSN